LHEYNSSNEIRLSTLKCSAKVSQKRQKPSSIFSKQNYLPKKLTTTSFNTKSDRYPRDVQQRCELCMKKAGSARGA